jgi:hypothetical protein
MDGSSRRVAFFGNTIFGNTTVVRRSALGVAFPARKATTTIDWIAYTDTEHAEADNSLYSIESCGEKSRHQ